MRALSSPIYRIDDVENNILNDYRKIGAPDYLSREQTSDLLAANDLIESQKGARVEGDQIKLDMQNSSTILVEVAFEG